MQGLHPHQIANTDKLKDQLRRTAFVKDGDGFAIDGRDAGIAPASLFVEQQGSYTIDLGLNADFWQKRLSAVLNVTDLFNWNRSQSWNTNPYLLGYTLSHTDSRFVTLSLTLRLGKMELQRLAREGEAN